MPSPKPSPAARALFWLAEAVFQHRAWFTWPHLVLAALAVWYTVTKLEFHTRRSDLVGAEKQYHKIYMEFRKEFPVEDDIVAVVESEEMEKNRQFVERLGAKLEAAKTKIIGAKGEVLDETNLFSHVFYKGDLKMMGHKALLFVPDQGLREMERTLQDFRPFLQQFTKATNLVSLFDLVNWQISHARDEQNEENKSLVKAFPALERIVDQATDGLLRAGVPPSPGINALFDGGQQAERQLYITFGNGRIYLATAQAVSEQKRGEAVERLRELVSETQLEVPGLNVGITGEPVLEHDEMLQSKRDSTLATVISLLLVALIFIYGYHETGRPLKATFCLLIGIAYTMGFTTLTVGHLNILTITFVPILIGIAIDFGVHLITRYEEELRHGRSQKVALDKAMVNTGMGIFTGGFTTAGAFFAMAFTDFRGIQEMGIICGGGLLVSLVPMMTLLPALLLRGRQNVLDHELGPILESKAAAEVDRRARIENFWLRRPITVGLVTIGITLLALVPARKVRFDYNLLNMQSAGLPAVIFQNKLIESSPRSVLFGVIVATNVTQATNLIATLTNLPTISTVDSMAPYLAEDVGEKLPLIRRIQSIAAEIQFQALDTNLVRVAELDQTLFALHGYMALVAKKVETTDPKLREQVSSLRQSISALRQRLLLDDRRVTAEKLTLFQSALFTDVHQTFESIRQQDASGKLRIDDLPPTLRNRFIGVTGNYLLQIYPKHNVWERKAQEEFVADLRKVDPRATGTPVQLLEYTTLLKNSFEQAALYSLAAIALLVFIHFWKVSCVVLSLIPVGVGFLWMTGLMGVVGIAFNPANIMTLPLVVGIGVTNGIHILNRFAEELQPSILAKSTGKAVLVSGLTTIAGFGSLIVAKHRGIESLGYVMATGTATCMFVGLTFLPALLNLLDRWGWTIKKTQRDNAQSTLGREEPR
jgi:hopanoid biosynthesis associated RND transporter like protein HpnN